MSLYELQDKLELLIKQYKALKLNEDALQEKVSLLESELKSLKVENTNLKEALMVKNISNNSDNEALKEYLDAIIAEIDVAIKKL
ncbi:MAG TPA: hypothetical protein VLZ83_02780 [Edaphocola sp.]|nr:hypothetical protein [Edaphocola sp.]